MIKNSVLIIGSAPNAVLAKNIPKKLFTHVVVINNAWRIRDDWDYLIHPDDFPVERRPTLVKDHQKLVTSSEYVPIQNDYGGFVYAGGTMAFTSAYWALGHLNPDLIAFIGCDMIYKSGTATHFYGTGAADPLRSDVSLQSLEAKSNRFNYHAARQDCLCINLTDLSESKLTYPKIAIENVASIQQHQHAKLLNSTRQSMNPKKIVDVLTEEKSLGYFFKSGKYWEHLDEISPKSVFNVDQLWLGIFLADSNVEA